MPPLRWRKPRDPERSFGTRTEGLVSKALAMVHLDAQIAIYIEGRGKRICFKTHPDMVPQWDAPEVDHLNPADFVPERGGELRILSPTKSAWRTAATPMKDPSGTASSGLSSPSPSFFSMMDASPSSSLNSEIRTEPPNPVPMHQVLPLPLPLPLQSPSCMLPTSTTSATSSTSSSSSFTSALPPSKRKRTSSDPPPPLKPLRKKRKMSATGKQWIQ